MPPRSKRFLAGEEPGPSTLGIRNVTVLGRRTSMRLEPEMWEALLDICQREQMTPSDICGLVVERMSNGSSLTAALRVFLLAYYRSAATEEGHERAGHGQGSPTILDAAFQTKPGGGTSTLRGPRGSAPGATAD